MEWTQKQIRREGTVVGERVVERAADTESDWSLGIELIQTAGSEQFYLVAGGVMQQEEAGWGLGESSGEIIPKQRRQGGRQVRLENTRVFTSCLE